MGGRKEDEIMAECLLKGGKMLEKTCRKCGCPQFEYKGTTFCVVCAEREQEKKGTSPKPGGKKAGEGAQANAVPESTGEYSGIASVLAATILDLCRRIREEEDPDRCLVLMDAVRIGTESLQVLRQL